MVEIRWAETADEKAAVAAFRYAIYVQEMGIYRDRADHNNRLLAEAEDSWSWTAYASEGGEVVGTTRLTWGGAGFTDRQIDLYGLAPFLEELPPHLLAVGERHMIAPAWRGSDLFQQLTSGFGELIERHGIRLVFGACEPHLLSYYCRFQRPCASRNINIPSLYLIPLVSFVHGPDALVDQGSHPGMPRCVQAVLDGEATVQSPLLMDPERYFRGVRDALRMIEAPLFCGLDGDELQQCLAGSSVIRCAKGDRVISMHGAARNVYVVLTGAVEVNDGERGIAVLQAGDVVGETAYLLHQNRTKNVDVVDEGTTLLSLSEHTLRTLTAAHPHAAARLLENISRILCERLTTVA